MQIRVTFANAGPDTVWGKLAAKLGREPTDAEATAEVRRILAEAHNDAATAGRLPHQRKR
jgi:hypothetical protein